MESLFSAAFTLLTWFLLTVLCIFILQDLFLARPVGIFTILDEESKFPRVSLFFTLIRVLWYKCQFTIRLIYFSLIVISYLYQFLEPTSTEQWG